MPSIGTVTDFLFLELRGPNSIRTGGDGLPAGAVDAETVVDRIPDSGFSLTLSETQSSRTLVTAPTIDQPTATANTPIWGGT